MTKINEKIIKQLKNKNKHVGSDFEAWLKRERIFEKIDDKVQKKIIKQIINCLDKKKFEDITKKQNEMIAYIDD